MALNLIHTSRLEKSRRVTEKAFGVQTLSVVVVRVPFGHATFRSTLKIPSGNACRLPSGKGFDDRLLAALPSELFQLDGSFQRCLHTAILLQHRDIPCQDGLLDSGNLPSSQWVVYGTATAEVARPTAQHSLGPPQGLMLRGDGHDLDRAPLLP